MNIEDRGFPKDQVDCGCRSSWQAHLCLDSRISDETLKAVHSYLGCFSTKSYAVERRRDKVVIYFEDANDLRMLQTQIPELIACIAEAC